MPYRPRTRWTVAAAGACLWLLGAAAAPAQAHPLGNFSVNHYTGFTVRPDRLDVLAVTDTAEIPTLQTAPRVDTSGDGSQSTDERARWAGARCTQTAANLTVTSPQRLNWTVTSAGFAYKPGQGGLRTSRLECRLHAPLNLADGPVTLRATSGADKSRVGWNEITAHGEGTHLQQSSVPETSATKELRNYPRDLLATPRGDTRAQFTAALGAGAPNAPGTPAQTDTGDGLTARVEALSRHLTSLAATERLTVPVGLLAVLLSIVLGAGHALLPGHGKTVMAAYLAGRRGRTRDAVTVGATVTITHTAGVLVIGLCLTAFSSLAGDAVLGWLGVTSGALVTLVGANLLTDALRRSRRARMPASDSPDPADLPQPALVGANSPAPEGVATTDGAADQGAPHHGHPHHHGHGHEHGHEHPHGHRHEREHRQGRPHRHGLLGHHHSHAPATSGDAQPFSTRGLVGLGIAGGLVPSPSALVVLLGAIALGRTVFGATLVLAYGLGMATTLTVVGLMLVRLGGQVNRLSHRPLFTLLRRIAPHTAILTALLVLIVGLGLMVRSLPPVL